MAIHTKTGKQKKNPINFYMKNISSCLQEQTLFVWSLLLHAELCLSISIDINVVPNGKGIIETVKTFYYIAHFILANGQS